MTDTEETRPNSLVAFGEMLLSWKMVIKIPTIISPATGAVSYTHLITPQQIFPVSSMWGYLANRARHELANNGKLPAPEQQRWVEDFAHAALGRRWRHADLADLEHIRHAADQLWDCLLYTSGCAPARTSSAGGSRYLRAFSAP